MGNLLTTFCCVILLYCLLNNNSKNKMSRYSIRDLEKLSGIKAHTIRIWEQRYNLIAPQRTETNIRFYTDADLKRLMNISILNRNGVKISNIARLNDIGINEKVLEISRSGSLSATRIENLIVAQFKFGNRIQF